MHDLNALGHAKPTPRRDESVKNSFLAPSIFLLTILVMAGCGSSGKSSTVAGITVTTPSNGASVVSPFNLSASATSCSNQPVTSIGYSLDSSTNTSAANSTSVNTTVSAATGTHTLHVKAWGSQGASCDHDVTVAVTGSTSAPATAVIPPDATTMSDIQTNSNWQAAHDPATGSTASGTMSMTSSPSLSGNARQFNSSFTNSGGVIYHVTFDSDPTPTNFFYDAWVYLTDSVSNMQNLEMDMNQVLSNGQTVIYGFQCDGLSGTWDYTTNSGTTTTPVDTWIHSNFPCNVRNWTRNQWHHVQISYSRDNSGNVTYHSVWLDGAESQINATVPSMFALGWTPSLITNFQVDGIGTGSNTVYLDELAISRW
jgi:hypothetical protein